MRLFHFAWNWPADIFAAGAVVSVSPASSPSTSDFTSAVGGMNFAQVTSLVTGRTRRPVASRPQTVNFRDCPGLSANSAGTTCSCVIGAVEAASAATVTDGGMTGAEAFGPKQCSDSFVKMKTESP